ncbi:unnamed protein product [Ilex paraguariensis]|uniref:Uncharacterized protein n=1 Tax=Ilex paraguariensis TaxID=185542 RepID=A0ABC8RLI8_9AQUA
MVCYRDDWIMKTMLVVFVACVLILGSLEANAKWPSLKTRLLLANEANLGRKVEVGADKGATVNKGTTEDTENKASSETDNNSTEGDNNESYQDFGQKNGSSPSRHYIIPCSFPTRC